MTATVVALSGRRIDAPGAAPAFPLERRAGVAAAVRDRLARASAGWLVCSAACGADLLALEAAAALGIESRIVLPFPPARFRQTSVVDRPGDWGPLFDRLCEAAARAGTLVTLDREPEAEAAYLETVEAILATAQRLAEGTGSRRLALAVWDGRRLTGLDVTGAFLDEARRRQWPVEEIPTHWPGATTIDD